MAEPSFDPGGFYEFNLTQGAVRTRDGARVLMLSDDVVGPLVSAAVRNGDLTALRRLGRHFGDQALGSLGGPVNELSPESVLVHVSSVIGLFGWGRLALERWGDALVAIVSGAPHLDDDALGIAALLGGLFSSLAGREVACVPMREDKFLLVDPSVAEKVWVWSREGESLSGIVGRLTPGEAR